MTTCERPLKRLRRKTKPSSQSFVSRAIASGHTAQSHVAAAPGEGLDTMGSRASPTSEASSARKQCDQKGAMEADEPQESRLAAESTRGGIAAEVASTLTTGMPGVAVRPSRSTPVATPARCLTRSQSSQPELGVNCALLCLSPVCAPLSVGVVFLDKEIVTFGNLPSCDVVLHSDLAPGMISRKHGLIQRMVADCGTATWLLSDTGSLNGILINGTRLHPSARHVLRDGDRVTFGRQRVPPVFEFVFQMPTGAASEKARQASASNAAIVTRTCSAAASQRQLESCTNVSALLRLSPTCPASESAAMVPLDRETVSFGRMPSCDVVLDSELVPGMISRRHGVVQKVVGEKGETFWFLCDTGSTNGMVVNGSRLGSNERRRLRDGDRVTFGLQIPTPVFEFTFELHAGVTLDNESRATLDVKELHSELACCICRDWMVHAATLECSHSFCWSCIDHWLLEKQFWCPVCRCEVTRDPLRTRAMDAIVQKTVRLLPESEQAEYSSRVEAADAAAEQARLHHVELQNQATASFHISANWKRKDREAFHKGVQDYTGDAREKYCGLHGLTLQFAHSADDSALNQALHNLQLQKFVSCSEEQIRRRLLLFMRYG